MGKFGFGCPYLYADINLGPTLREQLLTQPQILILLSTIQQRHEHGCVRCFAVHRLALLGNTAFLRRPLRTAMLIIVILGVENVGGLATSVSKGPRMWHAVAQSIPGGPPV